MKRSPQLIPLSREHHTALSLARRLTETARSTDRATLADGVRHLGEKFAAELDPHFAEEERWLLPALSAAGENSLTERTAAEHARMRALVVELMHEPSSAGLAEFAALLHDHVRFEERELFPAFERLQEDPRSWLL